MNDLNTTVDFDIFLIPLFTEWIVGFATLLLIGYFTFVYIVGYMSGSFPIINRIFKWKKSLSFVIVLPFIFFIILIMILQYNNHNTTKLIEYFMLLIIIISISTQVAVYAGTKASKTEKYGIIALFRNYIFSCVIIVFAIIIYTNIVMKRNVLGITEILMTEYYHTLECEKKDNKTDFDFSEMILFSVQDYAEKLEQRLIDKETSIINKFNEDANNYKKNYDTLEINYNTSMRSVKDLEEKYMDKINEINRDIKNKNNELDASRIKYNNSQKYNEKIKQNLEELYIQSKTNQKQIENLQKQIELFTTKADKIEN